MTSAERRLWKHLRAKRFAGLKFRRQTPIGPYIADFVCWSARLIVEVDGDTHSTSVQRRYDEQRAAALTNMGFRVIRVTNEDVRRAFEGVLGLIHHEASVALGLPTDLR